MKKICYNNMLILKIQNAMAVYDSNFDCYKKLIIHCIHILYVVYYNHNRHCYHSCVAYGTQFCYRRTSKVAVKNAKLVHKQILISFSVLSSFLIWFVWLMYAKVYFFNLWFLVINLHNGLLGISRKRAWSCKTSSFGMF